MVPVGEGWSLFTVDDRGRARQVPVEIGPMNDEEAMVRRGLSVDQKVIVHPGDRIANGVRVDEAD